jgi:hypothetical protein
MATDAPMRGQRLAELEADGATAEDQQPARHLG